MISGDSDAGSLRARQAEATRRRVAEAAVELFLQDGYAATTVAGVARHAGVSAQTVYNTFTTKAGLLKAAYDITLVGDAEAVPLAERPEVRALYETSDAWQLLHGYARLGRELLDRVGPLMLQVAAGAAAGEADLVAHQQVTDGERLTGTTMVAQRLAGLGALAPGVTVEQARDRIWTLNSVQVWHLLTGTRGWTGEQYQDWIGDAMCAAALGSPARPAP
ncbi:TetR/AcrR family transcriptional regulator [Jannaschia sp. R86511]|uniref:TetR/AcrR family transcriptional regulator n=1 Tax=Jannaschia sp. R86511 TaxID=3093853 RepID=UPI0036D36C8A